MAAGCLLQLRLRRFGLQAVGKAVGVMWNRGDGMLSRGARPGAFWEVWARLGVVRRGPWVCVSRVSVWVAGCLGGGVAVGLLAVGRRGGVHVLLHRCGADVHGSGWRLRRSWWMRAAPQAASPAFAFRGVVFGHAAGGMAARVQGTLAVLRRRDVAGQRRRPGWQRR